MKTWLAFLVGVMMTAAGLGLHQDSFGSLDGYCAYLHNGHWITDGSQWLAIFAIAFGVAIMTAISIDDFRSR
jgi:hypothetical protein